MFLQDDSGTSCELTLWGKYAVQQWTPQAILLVKDARIGDYNGRKLDSSMATRIDEVANLEDPETPFRAKEVGTWQASHRGTRAA